MNAWIEFFALWLADFYLAATILLTIASAIPPRAFISSVLTEAQIRASLRQQLGMKGRAARIATLRKRGRFLYGFTALTAGTLSIDWYYLPPGAHLARAAPVLFAAGSVAFPTAGTKTVVLRVTKAGRKLMRRRKRIALVAKGTFTPGGFIHLGCRQPYFETADILDPVLHFSRDLVAEDREALRQALAA